MEYYNLWFSIFEQLDFLSQQSFIFICRNTKDNFYITDLYNIDNKYLNRLNNDILQNDIFQFVTKLKANNKIINVSFMTNLKKLDAFGNCGIGQDGIRGLNLVELNAYCNGKITDVSFMTNLKILDAWGDCGIGQDSIHGLDLVELNARNNRKITDVSFMTNLKKLDAWGYCGINQDGIRGLNLVEINADYNSKIIIKSFNKNLK